MVEGVFSQIFVVTRREHGFSEVVQAFRNEEVALDNAWYSEMLDERAGLNAKYTVHECELVEVMPSMEP